MKRLARVAKVFIFYRNQLTGDDQVLLLTRAQNDAHKPGALDLPGGGVDEGESLQQALAREIHEEAGITIDPKDLVEVTNSGAVSNETNVEKHVFMVRIHNPEVILSLEHELGAWYPILEAVRLFPHPFYGKVLQYIIDHELNETV